MTTILKTVLGFISGKVGGVVSTGVQSAVFVSLGVWFLQNKDATFIVLSYGDLAFVAFTWVPGLVALHVINRRPRD